MATAKTETANVSENKKMESLFSKGQLQASKKFANRRDLLEVLLEDDKQYSISAVEGMVEKFMKGKVK